MKRLSGLIRYDKEFAASVATLEEQMAAKNPKPIVINGLTSGAYSAYLSEAVEELKRASRAPSLIIVRDDSEREKVLSSLLADGIRAFGYKPRDFVFHNISASHDTERERLSVLSALILGECDAVVTTPSAALQRTVPEELLSGSAQGVCQRVSQ